jgi:uncharacterized protein
MPRCPSCYVPLTRVVEEGVKQHTCPNCFGHWMNNLALTRLIRLGVNDAESGTSLVDLAETVAASDNRKPVRCAECVKEMLKDKFHPMIPVRLDKCKKCHTIWLDAGEYALLRALYRELMTSDDPEIVGRREKVARVMSDWEGRPRLADQVLQDIERAATPVDVGIDLLGVVLRSLR